MAKRKAEERAGELNVSRLGMIAATKRSTLRERTVDAVVGSRRYQVEVACAHGVPHGVDADVLLNLQTLYVLGGCPADRTVRTTPYELLILARLGLSGSAYARLRESLRRLYGTSFFIRDGWYDAARSRWVYDNESFRLLDKLRYRDSEDALGETQLEPGGTLTLVLSEDLAGQLRAGHLRLADQRILDALKEPASRSLYRLLDAHRVEPDGQVSSTLHFSQAALCELLGLGERSDNARRALESMHADLREAGYLREVRAEGRGRETEFSYQVQDVPDPRTQELIRILTANRVSVAVAERLAVDFPPERIREGVRLAREISDRARGTSRPIRSLAALTLQIIREPEKYSRVPEGTPLFQDRSAASLPARTFAPARSAPLEEEPTSDPEAFWKAMPLEAQVETLLKQLRVMRIEPDPAELRQVLEGGRSPREVLAAQLAAVRGGKALTTVLRGWLADTALREG